MPFEREYLELAAVADAAGSEAPTWVLTTAADHSLLFRVDVEAPFAATLTIGENGLWLLRIVAGDEDERTIRVGMAGDYQGVLRNVGLALLEVGEELSAMGEPGDFEFIAASLNFALAIDEKPVVATAAEALGRLLLADGSAQEGAELLAEYAIPAFRAIGQDQRAAALQRLVE
ncbi:hypothetical protein GCM10022288_23760 [Gryllotalpicola kribbensis]|jgi:hypothetical protein|uniref:Tetratricopeptide repeat protein n=1 Tax=Gryllotalpicola kribbensis TaxID=993084 RepID=A0ABP8AWE2_9MICO